MPPVIKIILNALKAVKRKDGNIQLCLIFLQEGFYQVLNISLPGRLGKKNFFLSTTVLAHDLEEKIMYVTKKVLFCTQKGLNSTISLN